MAEAGDGERDGGAGAAAVEGGAAIGAPAAPVPAEAPGPACIRAGWLWKVGENLVSWKKRWIALYVSPPQFGYYDDPGAPEPINVVPLTSDCSAQTEHGFQRLDRNVSFKVETLGRTWHFRVVDGADLQPWLYAFRRVIGGVPDMEERMSAVQFGRGTERLVVRDTVIPEPATGWARLRVLATGLSARDVELIAGGQLGDSVGAVGSEVLGEVVRLGPGTVGVVPGQLVAALSHGGGLAQFAVVPAKLLVPIPPVPPDRGVALVRDYVAALQILRRVSNVQPGESILVCDAADGIGVALCQLAPIIHSSFALDAGEVKAVSEGVSEPPEAPDTKRKGSLLARLVPGRSASVASREEATRSRALSSAGGGGAGGRGGGGAADPRRKYSLIGGTRDITRGVHVMVCGPASAAPLFDSSVSFIAVGESLDTSVRAVAAEGANHVVCVGKYSDFATAYGLVKEGGSLVTTHGGVKWKAFKGSHLFRSGRRLERYDVLEWRDKRYDWYAWDLLALMGLLVRNELHPRLREAVPLPDVVHAVDVTAEVDALRLGKVVVLPWSEDTRVSPRRSSPLLEELARSAASGGGSDRRRTMSTPTGLPGPPPSRRRTVPRKVSVPLDVDTVDVEEWLEDLIVESQERQGRDSAPNHDVVEESNGDAAHPIVAEEVKIPVPRPSEVVGDSVVAAVAPGDGGSVTRESHESDSPSSCDEAAVATASGETAGAGPFVELDAREGGAADNSGTSDAAGDPREDVTTVCDAVVARVSDEDDEHGTA